MTTRTEWIVSLSSRSVRPPPGEASSRVVGGQQVIGVGGGRQVTR